MNFDRDCVICNWMVTMDNWMNAMSRMTISTWYSFMMMKCQWSRVIMQMKLVAQKGQANQGQVGLVEVQLLLGEEVEDDEDHDEAPHLCVEIELQLVQLL